MKKYIITFFENSKEYRQKFKLVRQENFHNGSASQVESFRVPNQACGQEFA
jgi:hypothetical protein